MLPTRTTLIRGYWAATIATLAGALALLLTYTPTEATMGHVQKIFYVHLPMAINTFFACLIVFIASIGYLVARRTWWDDLAHASAKIAVLLCSGVLLTGMVWGKAAWGQWWTWSPRLTFSLMLWLLYVVYLVIRSSIESPQRRAMVCAVYGITAFLDVPLVWLSARLMPDIHPSSITLAPAMKITLMAWFVPVTLLAAGLVIVRFRLNQVHREREYSSTRGLPLREIRTRATDLHAERRSRLPRTTTLSTEPGITGGVL